MILLETKMDKSVRLMIVEDNARARRALKARISQEADICVMAEASNGQEAIRTINEQIPDIILMDIYMPVLNGLDATRDIKIRWPQIKVVILTMYPDNQPEAMVACADAFLFKGCSMEELTSTIRSLS